jgi:hypothetical protein
MKPSERMALRAHDAKVRSGLPFGELELPIEPTFANRADLFLQGMKNFSERLAAATPRRVRVHGRGALQ